MTNLLSPNPYANIDPGLVTLCRTIADRRLEFHKQLLEIQDPNSTSSTSDQHYIDEVVHLKEGGQLRHLITSHGTIYYATNGENWMFMERSRDDRIQTAYVYRKSKTGEENLSQNVILM